MNLETLSRLFGDEIQDPEEGQSYPFLPFTLLISLETFSLFTQSIPSSNLGFVSRSDHTLTLSLGKRDITIAQSPSLLTSNISTGTTGAVLWKVSPLVASWFSQPSNIFFEERLLRQDSTVLELGTGVAGIVALGLGPRVGKFIATDQRYVLKTLRENVESNRLGPAKLHAGKSTSSERALRMPALNIDVLELDWEITAISSLPRSNPALTDLRLVIGCDCIYNEALVEPFVTTCVELCQLNKLDERSESRYSDDEESHGGSGDNGRGTLCLIAQQLRSNDVFETWLKAFHVRFHVWRLTDDVLGKELGEDSGFVVHVGVLRKKE